MHLQEFTDNFKYNIFKMPCKFYNIYSATLLSLQLCGWKASEEDSDLDKDLNRKMVQAFMTFFMFHCL